MKRVLLTDSNISLLSFANAYYCRGNLYTGIVLDAINSDEGVLPYYEETPIVLFTSSGTCYVTISREILNNSEIVLWNNLQLTKGTDYSV